MSKQKFIRILFFIICFNFSFTYAKLPDTLFGIKLQSLEDEYVRLLFGPNMDNPSEQQQLSARLSAVQMCLDIDRDLAPLDLHAKTMANKARKLKKPLDNVEMRKIFDDLRTKIEQNQNNLGNSDLCKLWDFEQVLVELNRELNVQTPEGTVKLLKKDRVQLEKSFKCSDIEKAKEQNSWVFSFFTRHLSLKHFKYIDAKFMLGLSSTAQTACRQWFSTERMPAESELAYSFRMLSIRGAFNKLKMVKSAMELLLNEPELGLLEVRHALTLAAEAMREKIFHLTILEFFGDNPNIVANNGNFLEFMFVFGKILSYFRQFNDNNINSKKHKIENLWQSLAKLFQKLRDDQPAPLFNDLLSQVYSILKELVNEFGNQKIEGNFKLLIASYAKSLVKLYCENHLFRKTFGERILQRERLKQIFEIADGNRRLLSKKFWEIFEVEVITDNLNTNDSVDNNKSFLECPKVNGMHTGKTSAEEPAAHFLMTLYVGLMMKIENEEMLNNNSIIKELKQNLEFTATFWVYYEMIERELFEFADSLPDKNFDFLVNIGIYKMKWTKLVPELQSVAGDGQLCSLHKFALAFVQDKKLKENAGWDRHLKRLLDTSSTFINEPKLVLLDDDDGIDCMDVKLASQFVQKLRKVPNWTDYVHYYAITKLISKFIEFQSLFCYGINNVDSLMLKLRLNWIVQRNALRAIETTFPEIMHFEMQLEDTYVDVLLKKLEYKSNSFLAECYEALLSLPYLLKMVNDYENILLSTTATAVNQSFEDNSIRQNVQKKIIEIKEKIYECIKQNNPSNWRKNLCILINLNIILSAILPNNLHIFTLDNLDQWERLECNSEKDIKEAFCQQRTILKAMHTQAINKLLAPNTVNKKNRNKILALPGAKTKLWKMSKDVQQINSNSIVCDQQMNTEDDDVFADNKLLASHYDKILFANLDTCDRIAEHLQADLFVFVQWMDGKIRSARRSVANKRSEKFWENQKKNLESIYDRISDEDEPTALELNSENMGKFFYELKQYMEKGKKPLDEKWDEILLHNGCDTKGSFDPETKIKYEKWKQTMHKETIINLIRSDQKFTDRLKQAYKSANLKNDLIKIVGGMENADEIVKMLADDQKGEIVAERTFNLLHSNSPTKCNKLDVLLTEQKTITKSKNKKTMRRNSAENSNNSSQNVTPKTEKKREEVKKEVTQKREDDNDDITKVDDEICESVSENVQQNSPIFEEIFGADNCCGIEEQFSGLYLSNFEDNNLLATQFEKLIETVLMGSDDPSASIDSTVQLLHFGIYANEIGHRLKLTQHLKGKVLPEIGKATEFANIEREWNELKSVELKKVKNAQKLIVHLFLLLKKIVAKMDNFEMKNGQNLGEFEENIVRNQLNFRKFAKFIVENYAITKWGRLKKANRIGVLNKLLGQTNPMMEEQIDEDFKMLLKRFEKLNLQRNLDKIIIAQYKADPYLQNVEENPKKKDADIVDLYQISDGWQQMDFDENMSKNMKNIGLIQNILEINRQTEKERSAKWKAINEMRKLFEHWSDEARFQIPALIYLKPINEVFTPICMLPEGFDVTSKIFGNFQCELSERMICSDNSLFCIFCKNANVKFLQKYPMDQQMLAVPKLKINFMLTNFDVIFIIVPGIPQIPRQSFDGTQIRIFLHYFGKMLHKLLKESYFDEGNYEIDEKKRTELKRHLEEELFLTDDDDSAFRILNKIEALNKFDESAAKNDHLNKNIALEVRAKSTMNRQRMEKIKAILTVLWNHAIQLKVIELLLTRKEMFKMHRLDESVMNGRTLSNFRTIHAYVELWAKDKNLFNGQLNSQMIILMLTKVLLLFPGETSVPFLLEKFFLIYSLWDWPKPLQLTEINYEKKGEFLLWSPAREWFDRQQEKGDRKVWLGMPIISPIFPEQNVSNRIDTFTIKKMQNEFANAFNQVRTAKDGAAFVLAEESKKDDDKSDQKSFL